MKKILKRILLILLALSILAVLAVGIFWHVRKRPAGDDIIDVLMIGNSFSYHYTDELWGIADAAGIRMNVCNIYYSGCSLEMHWNMWKENQHDYRLRIFNEDGRDVWQRVSFNLCLAAENWDIITLQDSNKYLRRSGIDSAREHMEPYLGEILEHVRKKFPDAPLYWHQLWAYQIGYDRNGFRIANEAQQTAFFEDIRTLSSEVCQKYDIPMIPCGDAWQMARSNPLIGDTLCGRNGTMHGDYYHDGDIGGGQYLNACVWFEMLTGESCIGNTYRPSYNLSEEKILVLQQIAHAAVEAIKQ